MPQFSPMSWLLIALFLVGLVLCVYVSAWWTKFGHYSSVHSLKPYKCVCKLFSWGKSFKRGYSG
uniref:ATP synthase F0 subunit 8 n=1 Tax=Parvasolenaia rivularis TaxID=1491190 RepID=A0A3G1GH04_9BIVA|nr:ATP synthase F0 subunit 8 [Parvasolenaia rivularis]